MKTRFSILLLLLLGFFCGQAQTTKIAAKTSIDSLLPSGNAVQMVKVRVAFEKALNFTESVKSRSNHTGVQSLSTVTGLQDSLTKKVNAITGKGLSANDYSTVEKNKLAGIAVGATANDTDANLKSRANHTGTQAISTITGLESAINGKYGMFSLAQVRAFAAGDVAANPRLILTDTGKEGEWKYNAGSSATDNTGTVLVTSNGARYERVYEGAIKASWFEVSGDTHTGQSITRAVALAVAKFATTNSETIIIKSGINTVDNSPIYTAIPPNKKLTIKGEVGNIIDFLCVECFGAVFSNSASWTYADSVYTHGHIVLDGLNFEGSRNPTSSYLSVNYGTRPILYRNMQRVEVKNCSFKNIYGSALAVGVTGSVLIENNISTSVYARQPNATDATGDGIATIFAYCYNILIRGNYAKLVHGQYGRCGISVDDHCQNFIVTDNIVEGYERGIHAEHSKNGLVTKNNISHSPIGILSGINRDVIYELNVIDGLEPFKANELGYPGLVFFFNDTLTTFRNNIVKNWAGLTNTYLAKFWGQDITVEGNTFLPNRANAEIFGYGYNYRNHYINNKIYGGAILRIDYNYFPTVSGNEFWGGTIQGHYSEDAYVSNNTIQPDKGANIGRGLVMYNAVRPYCEKNTMINVTTYVIENTGSTDGVFSENKYLRKHASAAAYSAFYVDPAIAATGVKKTAKENEIRDFVGTPNTYHVGNTGTPVAY